MIPKKHTEKRIDEIKRLCEENNLKPSKVFREAKIPYSTLQNWDKKEPEAFETYDKLKETIKEMAKSKPEQK